jgi:hypothetical protein
MFEGIVNNVYLLVFIFSTLIIIRNLFFLIGSIRLGDKFKINNTALITLGLAISYFITSIINVLT